MTANQDHSRKDLDAAVLFIVFNKPNETQRVFEQIRLAKPKRLYVAADGPRSEQEAETCRLVREIATQVSWECDLKTLFQERNVGCQQGVKGAIDWFFASEEAGIILEDDCVPSQSFFRYCDELLVYYKDDERIGAICGTSWVKPGSLKSSYYFSRYMLVWGWASWARAWRHYDLELKHWPELRQSSFLSNICHTSWGFKRLWQDIFDACLAGKCNGTWDYQWQFSFWTRGYMSCVPRVNLVTNIGYGAGATHHTGFNSLFHDRLAREIDFPLIHPTRFVRENPHDNYTDRTIFRTMTGALRTLLQERIPLGSYIWRLLRGIRR